MPELTEVTSGLAFPEGPIAMPDGSVVLVEMFGPRLTRVHPDGTKETIAEVPGGPNGAARRPGRPGLRLQQRRPLHRDRHGRADVPRAGHQGPTTSAAASRPSTRRPARSTISTPNATAGRCGPRTTWCSTPTAASTSPTTASSTTRSGSHHLAGIYYAKADGSAITRGRLPGRRPQRHRPVARRHHAVLGRDLAGPDHAARRSRRPASSPSPASSTRRSASTASPASSCSTRWPSTATATSASRRSSTAACRSSRPPASSSTSCATGDSSPPTSASAATT